MNSPFVRWLLDLELIPEGAEGIRLAWERSWPGWIWALLIVVCVGFALWSYSALMGRRAGRSVLGLTRALMIVLLLAVISGPMLELPRETVEPDWVLMLVDRSASMGIEDLDEDGGRRSRDAQLQRVVTENRALWEELAEQRHVVWMGFHVGAFGLAEDQERQPDQASAGIELGSPDGRRTRLATSLDQALQHAAARSVSGVVVFTDGRTDDPPGRSTVRRLQADAIPVFTIPLGSPDAVGDLAIRRVDAPREAFVRDKVPVVVEIDRLGSAAQGIAGAVSLRDQLTGEELDRVELPADGTVERVTLTAEPMLAGEANWEVVLESDGSDLIPENNSKQFLVELIDRPLRVLFVDGYPRWEYRYLKNLMVREESIDSSVMLISADRDFAQEGNQPITRLPRSPEEFARFDVIVLGDTPASFFSPEQLEMIRNQVAQRGAGLLWIGGERYSPQTYAGTALADLLPMRGSLNLPAIGEPVNLVPTPVAEQLGVLRLSAGRDDGWPQDLADPVFGWSQLYWAQRIEPGRLKPTAEVLAETNQEVRGVHLPLVMQMRYGAGQTIYVATDEIWRWRYGRGELLPEQFWLQLLRMLGRESLSTAGRSAIFEVTPRRVELNQPIQISLKLLDAQLAQQLPPTVTIVLQASDGRRVAEVSLQRLDETIAQYGATYLPDDVGEFEVRLDDPSLQLDVRTSLEVVAPDDELRRPETDHPLLETLAATTGGAVLPPQRVGELSQLLPNRSVRTINPLRERIWDTPLVFALVLLLLTAEWIGRKVLRLV